MSECCQDSESVDRRITHSLILFFSALDYLFHETALPLQPLYINLSIRTRVIQSCDQLILFFDQLLLLLEQLFELLCQLSSTHSRWPILFFSTTLGLTSFCSLTGLLKPLQLTLLSVLLTLNAFLLQLHLVFRYGFNFHWHGLGARYREVRLSLHVHLTIAVPADSFSGTRLAACTSFRSGERLVSHMGCVDA